MLKIPKNLKELLLEQKTQLAIVFSALLITSVSILILGNILKVTIDQGFVANNNSELKNSIIYLAFIIILLSFSGFVRSYNIYSICEKIINKIRISIFSKVIYQRPRYFNENKKSEIISRLSNDVQIISSIIADIFSFSFRNLIMVVGSIIMMIKTNYQLSLYIIAALPIAILILIKIGSKVKNITKQAQQKLVSLTSNIEESLYALDIVQAYNIEKYKIQQFTDSANYNMDNNLSRLWLRSILVMLIIMLIGMVILIILYIGGTQVINNTLSAGELISFIYYAIIAATSLAGLSKVYADFQKALAIAERIFEYYDLKPISNQNKVKINDIEMIEFANVNFNYNAQTKVLSNLNFSLTKGDFAIIKGSSGLGKTTIFQLLLNFYDNDSGNISINDTAIKKIDEFSLREQIGYVNQANIIFTGTIYDNLCLGSKYSEDEINTAIEIAGLSEFIENLPDKIYTYIGEKGSQLSGGQKQRINIARALLRKPSLLLLDEVTSQLDEANEALIIDKIRMNYSDIIIIFITHKHRNFNNISKIIEL